LSGRTIQYVPSPVDHAMCVFHRGPCAAFIAPRGGRTHDGFARRLRFIFCLFVPF
jgi:hypothetical protein